MWNDRISNVLLLSIIIIFKNDDYNRSRWNEHVVVVVGTFCSLRVAECIVSISFGSIHRIRFKSQPNVLELSKDVRVVLEGARGNEEFDSYWTRFLLTPNDIRDDNRMYVCSHFINSRLFANCCRVLKFDRMRPNPYKDNKSTSRKDILI